jgi:hypothetical protein
MRIRTYLHGVELVRMSDGSYCVVRHLGKLKGGLGMRCHETLLRLTPEGIASKFFQIGRYVFNPRMAMAS